MTHNSHSRALSSRWPSELFTDLLVVGLATPASAIAAFAAPPIVTQAGPVKGVRMFGVDAFLSIDSFTPGQRQISDAMVSYWTKFATTGDLNSPNEPAWLVQQHDR